MVLGFYYLSVEKPVIQKRNSEKVWMRDQESLGSPSELTESKRERGPLSTTSRNSKLSTEIPKLVPSLFSVSPVSKYEYLNRHELKVDYEIGKLDLHFPVWCQLQTSKPTGISSVTQAPPLRKQNWMKIINSPSINSLQMGSGSEMTLGDPIPHKYPITPLNQPGFVWGTGVPHIPKKTFGPNEQKRKGKPQESRWKMKRQKSMSFYFNLGKENNEKIKPIAQGSERELPQNFIFNFQRYNIHKKWTSLLTKQNNQKNSKNPLEPLYQRYQKTGITVTKLYKEIKWVEDDQERRRKVSVRTTPGRILINEILLNFTDQTN